MDKPLSGLPRVDRYLEEGYAAVRGMSSRFAAAISAWLLEHQAQNGIGGHFVEIGTFQGRYFIAMALALRPGERALGIDLFDWPSEATLAIFEENCRRWGVEPIVWQANTGAMTAAGMRAKLGAGEARFVHVDGDHSDEALAKDLDLARDVLHPQGLICLDDMLHPGYPFLVTTVERWLKSNPDFLLSCIIDREDIVAAPKFLICRREAAPLYEQALMARFPQWHFVLGGDALGHHCVVLTPHPRIAEVD